MSYYERKQDKKLQAYKRLVVSKGKYYGETDTKNKVIKINKKIHKTKPLHKRRYPELADSIYHEREHALHPKMHEKTVYKRTHKAMKTISKKESQKLYRMFQ